MMNLTRKFLSDRRGLAAMEFALIAPLLVGLLVFGADGWMRTNQQTGMRSALQSAARYYQLGGSDDAAAHTLAMNAWTAAPADGTVTIARTCACAGVPVACTSLCNGTDPPMTFINFTSTGTFTGLMHQRVMSQSEILRVR